MKQADTGDHVFALFGSEAAAELFDARRRQGFPAHLSPYSTLIAAMGQHWEPGCREAVMSMAQYTWEQGVWCAFYEEADICVQPFDAIGTMRNHAYRRAIEEGYEYLLYVDTDVKPEEDALWRILQRWVPIIAPIPEYPGPVEGLSIPKLERGRGLAMVTSTVISFVLFRVSVFRPWTGGEFWSNAVGADEKYHFDKLRAATGHQPFIDTDVVVKVVKPPTFPLDKKVRPPKPPPGVPKPGKKGW